MMSYPSKTGKSDSDGLDPGEHGGMAYLTMGPRKGPGSGRFLNLYLHVADSFEAHASYGSWAPLAVTADFVGGAEGKHICVSHVYVGPQKQHI